MDETKESVGGSAAIPLWKAGLESPLLTAEWLIEAEQRLLEAPAREPWPRIVSPSWWHRATAYGPHTAECEEMWGLLSDMNDGWPEDCCGYAAKWAAR